MEIQYWLVFWSTFQTDYTIMLHTMNHNASLWMHSGILFRIIKYLTKIRKTLFSRCCASLFDSCAIAFQCTKMRDFIFHVWFVHVFYQVELFSGSLHFRGSFLCFIIFTFRQINKYRNECIWPWPLAYTLRISLYPQGPE